MRLCKPGFFFRLPVPFQPGEQGASSLREDDYGLSGTLTLPQSFGDIYLGETFSCYISLCNSAPITLSSVGPPRASLTTYSLVPLRGTPGGSARRTPHPSPPPASPQLTV